MSNDLSSLTEDHVRQLGRIIGTLEQSTFDFLQLEVGDLKVTIGKGNVPLPEVPAAQPTPQPSAVAPAVPPSAPAPQVEPAPAAVPPSATPTAVGAVEITSPIMGMFYTRPEPGAATFVTVGASVEENSTVGLVEVMKTFNAVSAGVRGTIVEVCAPDAQLVEYGQVLFRVAQG